MKFKFGIREKLLVPILLGLVVITYILFFVWQPSQLTKAKQQFVETQTNLIKTLSPSIIQNILANDLAELHRVFENSKIIHKNEWRYIKLSDSDKKPLYPIFPDKPIATKTLVEITHTIEENNEIFGYITLYTDWKLKEEKELKNINQLSLLSIFLFAGIAAFSFILQTKWIYTPITKLKDITSQFSENNYEIKLPAITSDEIGLLTSSIEHMRNKIHSTLEEVTNKEKMTRAILETAPDAIITMDNKGEINSFNPGAEKIFGYSACEIIGEKINILMPANIAIHHDQYISVFNVASSKVVGKNRELNGLKKDGSLFPIELTINASVIDGKKLFTGVLRDVTERKKTEQIKSEFIATVSHELRTPLTAIKGSLDIITNGLDLKLPEQAKLMLDIACRNVERLLTLINDILDISKLESGEINFLLEEFDISPFIKDAIELNQEYAREHHTSYECTYSHADILINADKDRLTQVMSNLLSNAAKYSPKDIPVEIFTTLKNGYVRINVKDYGLGVPKEFQDKLFGKFTQSNSGDTREVGGTGLGLNISKKIIERLEGNIGFETIEGKETTFYFELPIISNKKL